MGNPVKLLIFAGSLNGLILPISLGVILLAANNKKILNTTSYEHPMILTVLGWIMVVFTAWMGFNSLTGIMELF